MTRLLFYTLAVVLFIAQPVYAQQHTANKDSTAGQMKMMKGSGMGNNMMDMPVSSADKMVTINLKLKEFAYKPDTLRIPAGKPVKIILDNIGQLTHEFMAGRGGIRPDGDGFQKGLFQNVKIYHSGGMVETDPFMIDVKPGEQASVAFTLPPSKKGVWKMGCFLKADNKTHYQLGMKGVVIVK